MPSENSLLGTLIERLKARIAVLTEEGIAHLRDVDGHQPLGGPDLECPNCDSIYGELNLLRDCLVALPPAPPQEQERKMESIFDSSFYKSPSEILEAPCRWCGYSGEGYWQAQTHAGPCPFRFLAGRKEREALLLDYPTDLKASMLAASPPAQEQVEASAPMGRGVSRPSVPNGEGSGHDDLMLDLAVNIAAKESAYGQWAQAEAELQRWREWAHVTGQFEIIDARAAASPPAQEQEPPMRFDDVPELHRQIATLQGTIHRLEAEKAALPPAQGWQPEKEFCVCAAVKTVEGKIVRGHRHDGAIRYAEQMGLRLVPYGQDQQGFVTSRGRYVDRIEGAELQRVAGIKSVDDHRIDFPTELFSEDLY